jgi:hypothetical protein
LACCENRPNERHAVMTLFYLTRMINFMKHLLTRFPGAIGRRCPAELIPDWFEDRIRSNDRSQLHEQVIERQDRWDPDRLGIFLLRRFHEKEEIERVQIDTKNGGAAYTFSREFCDPKLIRQFWREARDIPIELTGSGKK